MTESSWRQQIAEILQEFEKAKSNGDQQGQIAYFWTYVTALEVLAEDAAAPPEDRKFAQDYLQNLKACSVMAQGSAIAELARQANSETNLPAERQEARKALSEAASRLSAEGKDISHWIKAPVTRQ